MQQDLLFQLHYHQKYYQHKNQHRLNLRFDSYLHHSFHSVTPTSPLPDWLNEPTGPEVFEVTFLTLLSESTKIPEVTADPDIVADPAVPAVLVLKGPCTPPPVPEAPPPAPKVKIEPVVEPDKVVFVPALPILG
jgi:hypothetical protein